MQGRSQVDHARIAPQCGIVADAFRSLSGSLYLYHSEVYYYIGYSTVLYPVQYSIRRYRLPVPVKRHLGPGTVQYHRELDVPVQYNVPVQYATVRRVRAKRSGERNKRKVDFVSRLLELSMLSTALSVVCWSPSRIAFH